MRKLVKITAVLILIVVLFLAGAFFFMFTNAGVGLTEMFSNWKQGDPPIPEQNEIVMPPDTTITTTTKEGTIAISSGKGLKRYYTWDGATRSVVMWPRSERWYGSLGLYYPGPGSHWVSNHGITCGVVQEGQQYFNTLEEAEAWLEKDQWLPCVWNDSGLVVCFGKSPDREQINVDVWQIYIEGHTPSPYLEAGHQQGRIHYVDGKKTMKLTGSQNAAITASWASWASWVLEN